MFYVPLYFEAIRSRPVLVFWLATLAQAVLWLLVPMLFYTAPPAELAQVLAIGHEFQFDSDVGPPLAFWLAEIAFRIGGLFGVYVLAQICVVATYWAVFKLGSAIVGPPQAVIAVLLMVGVSPFTVPSPAFGPPAIVVRRCRGGRAPSPHQRSCAHSVGSARAVHGLHRARARGARPDRAV